mmetsp:Transcript_5684/g.13564  ORF Transcript_5684/g.13564 Transcript_5684/m.13564 type:complete len:84 (+) Transcript_5684:1715-1966(+)
MRSQEDLGMQIPEAGKSSLNCRTRPSTSPVILEATVAALETVAFREKAAMESMIFKTCSEHRCTALPTGVLALLKSDSSGSAR